MGIYRIINTITNQSYIGQSRDIMERIEQHFYHRSAVNASDVDKAIGQYGIENFVFQILELCKFEELDYKEDYYITMYDTNVNGYNVVYGGQHNIGESNSNSKLTYQDVYFIREAYNDHIDPNYLYANNFAGILSISYFFNLWEGRSWQDVHMDVYTQENLDYYKNLINNAPKNKVSFTDDQIMEYRNRYVNETAEQIYNSIATHCNFNTFKSILCGDTYRHLPVYRKKTKQWVTY